MYKMFLFPPGLFLAVGLVALIVFWRRPRAAWWSGFTALFFLYVFSTPLVSDTLMRQVEVFPPLSLAGMPSPQPQAIVILSGDDDDGFEYGGETVGTLTLVRMRYGVFLYHRTHLPILVSGGTFPMRKSSLADDMRRSLIADFSIPEVWVEDKSMNTWENAVFSAAILKAKGIDRVYLVTHAWHMARARWAFERAGLAVVPAPTAYAENQQSSLGAMLPSAHAAMLSYYALHELVGGVAYRLYSWTGMRR